MVRIKHATATRNRKKRVIKLAKGSFGRRKSNFTQAIRTVIKGLQYAYRDRKNFKREIRSLWIARINAGARDAGMTYSQFMNGLKKANVDLNRKMLAEIAATSPGAFRKVVKIAQDARAK